MAAGVFSGTDVKILKDNLDINGKIKILTGTVDPSSVATSAPAGSFYHNTTTGIVYRKTDAGSTTNWVIVGNPTIDGVTIEDSGGLRVKDLGISTGKLAASAVTTAKITDLNVTRAKLEAVGQQVSSSTGTITGAGSDPTYIDVTNATVSITTTGRPVLLLLQPDGTTTPGYIKARNSSSDNANLVVKLVRGASDVAFWRMGHDTGAGIGVDTHSSQWGLQYLDVVAAGTYTYKLMWAATSGVTNSTFENMKLVAFEL